MDPHASDYDLAYRIVLITAPTGKRRHRWAIMHTDTGERVELSEYAYLSMGGAFEAAEARLKAWLEGKVQRPATPAPKRPLPHAAESAPSKPDMLGGYPRWKWGID